MIFLDYRMWDHEDEESSMSDHDDEEENTLKCKGCNFYIKREKLFVHLNLPSVRCKEAFTEEESSIVYKHWMKSKVAKIPMKGQTMSCKACHFEMDKYDLVFHLNDKKVQCKKAYSQEEYSLVFEYWLSHKADGYIRSMKDLPCDGLYKCHGCEETLITGKMENHLESSAACLKKYTSQEISALHSLAFDYTLLIRRKEREAKEAAAREQHFQYYFKNVLEIEAINNIIESKKPYFIDYGVISDFVERAMWDRDDLYSYRFDPTHRTIAVLLGHEDEYGYHGKELLYLPKQSLAAYRYKLDDSTCLDVIKNSKTFKDYQSAARVMVWMSAHFTKNVKMCFDSYDAHIQMNWKELFPCAISMKVYVPSEKKRLENGDYAFYELNQLGQKEIKTCNANPKHCKHEVYQPFDNALFNYKDIKVVHSMVVDITYVSEDCEEISEIQTKPKLFDCKYFASPKPESEQMSEMDITMSIEIDLESDSDENDIDEQTDIEVCKSCNEPKNLKVIMKHLAMKSECKAQYSDQDMAALQAKIKHHRNAQRRSRRSKTNAANEASNQEKIQCKVCKTVCWINTIRRHLAIHPNCQAGHSMKDLERINQKFSNYERTKRSANQKLRRKENQSEATINIDGGVSQNYFFMMKFKIHSHTMFQFGTVSCAVCKRKFDLNRIKYHLSNSNQCLNKFPREALNTLLLKNEERKRFVKQTHKEETDVAELFTKKQKARDAANAQRAKTVARWKKSNEENSRSTNFSSMNQLKRKIDEIETKDLSEEINQKLTHLMSEINELYKEIERNIDAAAMKTKDYQDINSVADAYRTIVGNGKKKSMLLHVIPRKYDEFHAKLKDVLKEIADNILQPQLP